MQKVQKGFFQTSSMNLELLIFENSWWCICVACVLWRSRRYSTQGGFVQVLQSSTCEQAGCWLSWGQTRSASTATSVKSSMKSENSLSYVETPSLLAIRTAGCPLLRHVHAFSILSSDIPTAPAFTDLRFAASAFEFANTTRTIAALIQSCGFATTIILSLSLWLPLWLSPMLHWCLNTSSWCKCVGTFCVWPT